MFSIGCALIYISKANPVVFGHVIGNYYWSIIGYIIGFFTWTEATPLDEKLKKIIDDAKNEKELKKIVPFFKKSAEAGDISAQVSYGILLKEGKCGVAQNLRLARDYLKLAADKGDKVAQRCYAFMLIDGLGGIQNDREAFVYLKSSSDQGDSDAQFCYGLMLSGWMDGLQDSLVNPILANEYFRKSAEQGNEKAKKIYNALADLIGECNGSNEEILRQISIMKKNKL
ncbi:MAG: hypothetical protein C0412_21775 [Flavobacterium sp.]|nr:hypothetical protein [Flavobacterium sp.]